MTSFQTRWLITGSLTVRTALHIGAGETHSIDIKGQLVEVSTVVRDYKAKTDTEKNPIGKPYIPGATLKGNLRAWLQTQLKSDKKVLSLLNNVFGYGKRKDSDDQGQGGKTEFWDARIQKPLEIPTYPPPYWDEKLQTGIEVGVTIDRVMRTAREQRLFHWEIVPPDVCFEVNITGNGLSDQEVALLLFALKAFNREQQPITLGRETAQGKGQMVWQLEKIQKLDKENTIKWLTNKSSCLWYEAEEMEVVDEFHFFSAQEEFFKLYAAHPTLRVDLQLNFDTPFLVNEPSQEERGEDNPNHRPRYDHKGKVVLPAKSFRGAFRSQAERIIRTLKKDKACFVDDVEKACPSIEKLEELENLCLACQLFGATGWKTPIHISDFTLVGQQNEPQLQDFVAIDRFTGGSSKGQKFNAEMVYAPTLKGFLEIDLHRIEPWGLGLLALVIRDLIQGDITFGFGAAKGYGHCTVKDLPKWSLNTLPRKESWKDWIELAKNNNLDVEVPQQWQDGETVRYLLNELVKAFQEEANKNAKK